MSEIDSTPDKFSNYTTAILLLMGLNLVLGSAKLFLGYLVHSSALRSDGWNNAADFVYSLLLTVGLWISTQPPDESHPEGHDRFQSVMGFLVAMVILGTGFFVLYDSYISFVQPRKTLIGTLEVTVVVLSMFLKGGIGWFLLNEGNRLESPALKAIGWDQTADIFADLAVLVALLATYFELFWIDPAVAGLIGLLILRIGWEPLTENLGYLTGQAPGENLIPKITPLIENSEVFEEVTDLRAHYVGPTLHVILTVKAPSEAPLSEVHRAEEALRKEILDLPDVSRAFIHVEPPEVHSPH